MVRKVIAVFCFAILFAPGCVKRETYPMPEKNLTPEQEEKISRMLNNKSRVPQLNKELLDMGELAVPVILQKIYELNKKLCNKTGYGHNERVTMSCDEGNLIIALGAIKSKKAVPALIYMLKEERKFRNETSCIANALSKIGDRRAIKPLKDVFERELGYLKSGDYEGPDYGWGLAADFTCQCIGAIGKALCNLGDRQIIGKLIDAVVTAPGKFPHAISMVLTGITGTKKQIAAQKGAVDMRSFWSDWWKKNKDSFSKENSR